MAQDRVIPSFIEQMAMRHYEHTDANARTVPWDDLPRVRRQTLLQATTAILDAVLAYVESDEASCGPPPRPGSNCRWDRCWRR